MIFESVVKFDIVVPLVKVKNCWIIFSIKKRLLILPDYWSMTSGENSLLFYQFFLTFQLKLKFRNKGSRNNFIKQIINFLGNLCLPLMINYFSSNTSLKSSLKLKSYSSNPAFWSLKRLMKFEYFQSGLNLPLKYLGYFFVTIYPFNWIIFTFLYCFFN